jgi:hypothetical protein
MHRKKRNENQKRWRRVKQWGQWSSMQVLQQTNRAITTGQVGSSAAIGESGTAERRLCQCLRGHTTTRFQTRKPYSQPKKHRRKKKKVKRDQSRAPFSLSIPAERVAMREKEREMERGRGGFCLNATHQAAPSELVRLPLLDMQIFFIL